MLTKGNIKKSFGKVSINDVLERKEVKPNNELIASVVNDKVVLVTGAAGSISSELFRQTAELKPKLIIGVDINESELYSFEQTLKVLERQNKKIALFIPFIASIRDCKNMFVLIKNYQVDVIFHLAAHKHVPLMETAYIEAIKNNVLCTYILFYAAINGSVIPLFTNQIEVEEPLTVTHPEII